MACEKCVSMVITTLDDVGPHHHRMCPKYKTEKFTYLMYYEDGENCWTVAPDKTNDLIYVDEQKVGEIIDIQFKRCDFTDAEFDALPEV